MVIDQGLYMNSACAHQRHDMCCGARRQALHAVSAFEHRDDAPVAAVVGHSHQLLGNPAEVAVLEFEGGQRVEMMRIEASRDYKELRRKCAQGGQDLLLAALAEPRRIAAPGQ